MPAVPLSLESLGDLDQGIARHVVDKALTRAVKDFEDRGQDGKPRTVTITVHMQQSVSGAMTWLEVACKVPGYKTAATHCKQTSRADGKPELLFQPNNADNADQETIYDKENV